MGHAADVESMKANCRALAPSVLGATPTLVEHVYGDLNTPVTANVLGVAIHTQDAEELRYVILTQIVADDARVVIAGMAPLAGVMPHRASLEHSSGITYPLVNQYNQPRVVWVAATSGKVTLTC